MVEIAPGIHAIEVPCPYRTAHHTVHSGASEASGVPLRVRTRAPAASFVVSFPTSGRAAAPLDLQVLGWVTRGEIELIAGDATLAYLAPDNQQILDEQRILPGEREIDLVAADLSACAALIVRAGAPADEKTEIIVRTFRMFAVADEEATLLRTPPDVEVGPMKRWNRFFGYPGRDLAARLRYLRYERLTAPRPMRWLEGLELVIAPGEQISRAVYVSGLYEPCTATVLRELLKPGATFVDVGANIGVLSLLAARWVGGQGRVIAVEPSAREFRRLLDHVGRNHLPHVATYQVAAGDRAGRAVLHVADQLHGGLNTLEPRFAYDNVAQDHEEHVDVVRLDDLLARDGAPRVDVIKIDVEGSEHRVVAGATAIIDRHRPVLLVEVAGPALEPAHEGRDAMEALLRARGYSFAAVDADEARLVPVPGLRVAAENLVAAPPDVVERLVHRFGATARTG